MDSDGLDKLEMWLPCNVVVKAFLIRGPGTVECTRRAPLGDGIERVDKGKLVVTRKLQ